MNSPASIYHHRLQDSVAQQAREQRRHIQLGYGQVAILLAGAIAALLLLHAPSLYGLLLIPIAAVVALFVVHERVLRSLRHWGRITEFYQRGLGRVENRWIGTGETGERFLDPAHPYARDLDIFGTGSLFELLCTARTRAGEETLARWLLQAAPPEEIRERQAAIMEMKERFVFRERLFATGESVRLGVRPDILTAWGEGEPVYRSGWIPYFLAGLGTLWVVAWIYCGVGSWYPLLTISVVNFLLNLGLQRRLGKSANNAEKAGEDLKVLAEVLNVMEQETFVSPRLRRLRASLDTGLVPPSTAVKRLALIVEWLEARRNMIVQSFAPFTFYNVQLAMAAERWQQRFGPAIRGWLSTVGEFEALSALASFAWEHPANVLPEFVEQRGYFEAVGLAHPLLPEGTAIGNDLKLGRGLQLIVISGPNMAGKSTFLRGVGMNAVLAQCGAPVRAMRLQLSPLAVGASICVLDSLQGGVSRFYAEIKRLKLLSDLAQGPTALLFLLDELLSGTNSHDRYEGTRYVVRALVRRGAIGLVTTHDLALTEIPETMGGVARNSHFEDDIQNGELKFDYRLHPGIVRTSNALKLMQAVGLELEE